MSSVPESEVEVFIVGGGPVGMLTALLLDRFEIRCVVVERNPGLHDHPRAKLFNARTLEIFRVLGLDQKIRRAADNYSEAWGAVENLTGRELFRTFPETDTHQSPCWKIFVDQNKIEQVMLEALEGCKYARILFSAELLAFEEVEAGVRVRTRSLESQVESDWTARYLIGADGASSTVRDIAEIELEGGPPLGVVSSEYWRADLSKIPNFQGVGGLFIVSPDPQDPPMSSVLRDGSEGRFLSMFNTVAKPDSRGRPWDDEKAKQMIQRQIGDPSVDVELTGHDVWSVRSVVAERYRSGRVFLAGDAAHQMPPAGGFGLNTGFQDAHNLVWKLAMVLNGHAGEELLDTYEIERLPVAQSNAAWSSGNAPRLLTRATSASSMPTLGEAVHSGNSDRLQFVLQEVNNHTHSVGRALGFTYPDGALISDGSAAPVFNSRVYTPSDRPGGRFPHIWLDTAARASTIDWFDRRFVLVAGPMGSEWLEAGLKASEALNIPLDLQTLPRVEPADGFRMGLRGAALVRPDGHVAWRRPWLSDDPLREVTDALQSVLMLS